MNYMNITHDDMANGVGLRVVLWVAGCSHHCKSCQNPTTWDENAGIIFDDDARNEIFHALGKSYIHGITFSGGDPLFFKNRETITSLAKEIKELFPNKSIWCYTGYEFEDIQDLEITKYVDVFVVGKFKEELADVNFKWAGSTNQRVMKKQCDGSFINESSTGLVVRDEIVSDKAACCCTN